MDWETDTSHPVYRYTLLFEAKIQIYQQIYDPNKYDINSSFSQFTRKKNPQPKPIFPHPRLTLAIRTRRVQTQTGDHQLDQSHVRNFFFLTPLCIFYYSRRRIELDGPCKPRALRVLELSSGYGIQRMTHIVICVLCVNVTGGRSLMDASSLMCF